MTKDVGFKLTRIGQIAINVRDVERATAFYRDKLELKFLFAAGNMAWPAGQDGPTHLKLTRQGGRLLAWARTDAGQWQDLAPLDANFGPRVPVGVVASTGASGASFFSSFASNCSRLPVPVVKTT